MRTRLMMAGSAAAAAVIVLALGGNTNQVQSLQGAKVKDAAGIEQSAKATDVAINMAASKSNGAGMQTLLIERFEMTVPLTATTQKQLAAMQADYEAKAAAEQRDWASIEVAMNGASATMQTATSNLPKRETAGDILRRFGEKTKT